MMTKTTVVLLNDDGTLTCPACQGKGHDYTYLRRIGRLEYYRCPYCGAGFNVKPYEGALREYME